MLVHTRPPRRGDQYRVPLVTTSDGRLERDVVITAVKVTRLHCGCHRLDTTRPGPADGKLGIAMQLLVTRCADHAKTQYDEEPERVATT